MVRSSNEYIRTVNSIRNNRTTVSTFENYTKSGTLFKKHVAIKTIMEHDEAVYRVTVQHNNNRLIDVHAFKSYLDTLFGKNHIYFTTIFKRSSDDEYRVYQVYTFANEFEVFTDDLLNKPIHNVIEISSGERKIKSLIHKPENFHKTITIYSNYTVHDVTYHIKNVIILNSIETNNEPTYLFGIHLMA
jgi:hypothetical protein